MPDLGLLDSLIAMVVVLLVLSLIVQSIQSALKKLLKIKSRQIEDSLLDLFENALGATSAKTQGVLASSPVLRMLAFRRKHPAAAAQAQVKELYDAVWNKFGEVGRVAQSGRVIFDSISKEDLLKVMARVAPGTLLPGFAQKLEDACRQVLALEQALAAVGSAGLSGESAARLASLRQAVAPMVNDVNAVFKGQALDPAVLIGDVVRLREVRLDTLLTALADLQKGLDREIVEAKQAGRPTTALDAASQGVTKVADLLAALASKFDAALAPLRTRLRSVETWYDTVMQSFDERYSRGMRTWAFVLSLLVVVASDANFFTVFGRVLNGDVASIVKVGENYRRPAAPAAPADAAPAGEADPGAPAATSPAPTGAMAPAVTALADPARTRVLLAGLPAAPAAVAPALVAAQPAPAATEPPAGTEPVGTEPAGTEPAGAGTAPEETATVQEDIDKAQSQFKVYTDMGFQPLTWTRFKDKEHFGGIGPAAKTLAGWLVMALLLSVGAPFWQDTLESLFGIKNLLRKQGGIQNVEQRSGEGNPKQA